MAAERAAHKAGSPKVSLGLPVRNGMPLLVDALASLLAQDEQDIEIVISDNASDDGTEGHCRAIAARDPRVKYFRSDTNRGAAANFQKALSLSSAPFFSWAAHDDLYTPRYVSSCLGALKARPEAALCVPAHRRVDESGTLLSVRKEPVDLGSQDLEARLRAHLWRRGWLTIYGLWRRPFLERVGPPPPVWGSDVILVWRALLVAPVHVLDEALADYTVVRTKSADSVLFGITATPSSARFPNTRMLGELQRASEGLGLSEEEEAVARRVLRRWVLTRQYRELACTDLLIESRRYASRGARLRAAALIPPAALLSPRMAARGVRLATNRWRASQDGSARTGSRLPK